MRVSEVTHWMALVPLLYILALAAKGEQRETLWWVIAAAFGISALADSIAHHVDPLIVGAVYPIVQSALIASVLVSRTKALLFMLVLVVVSLADTVIAVTIAKPEWILRTVAWLGLVVLIWTHPLHRLKIALIEAFGVGWMAWVGLLVMPGPPNAVWGSPSWLAYQAVRATSLLLFCWALARETRQHNLAIQ